MKNAINCIRDILQYVCNLMHEAELIRCVRKNLKEYHTIKIIRIRQVTLLGYEYLDNLRSETFVHRLLEKLADKTPDLIFSGIQKFPAILSLIPTIIAK